MQEHSKPDEAIDDRESDRIDLQAAHRLGGRRATGRFERQRAAAALRHRQRRARRERVFSCCAMGEGPADWPGPVRANARAPTSWCAATTIAPLADTFTAWDEGIAAQTIMLQAVEAGFGGCIIASFKKRSMAEALGVDADRFQPTSCWR